MKTSSPKTTNRSMSKHPCQNLLSGLCLGIASILGAFATANATTTISNTASQNSYAGYSSVPFTLTTTASPYNFLSTGYASLTSITGISVTLTLEDGDTALGNFDYNNLTLALDGLSTGIKLNGFDDNTLTTLTFTGSPLNASGILNALQVDGKLAATILDATPNDNYLGIPFSYSTTLSITGDTAPVPEPATGMILLIGGFGVWALRHRRGKSVLTALLVALNIGQASAATVTNGALSVTISDGNGAIDTVTYGGSDYFNPGSPVSDWGMQVGSNTASFAVNTTNGAESIPTTVSAFGGTITASSLYTYGGANVGLQRAYSLVSGLNVIKIVSTFTNNLAAPITLRYFDTTDPDQGVGQGTGYSTYMDVKNIGGAIVGTATESGGLSVNFGGFGATVASGGPFSITDGSTLNAFFASPVDGNGTYTDSGLHLGYQVNLGANATLTYTSYMAFGNSAASADSAFALAVGAAPVPEPSTWAMIGMGAVGLYGLHRNRMRKEGPSA